MLAAMSPVPASPKPGGNPVFAARRAAWSNIISEAATRPALTTLIAALCLGCAALSLAGLHALLLQHAGTVSGWLIERPAVIWVAVFLLCLAVQVPPARRDAAAARSGWLSALPQMPRAMHRWSRWRSFGLAVTQAVVLSTVVLAVHRMAAGSRELVAWHWLPAVLVPLLAWQVLPLLTRPRNRVCGRARSRPRAPRRAASVEPTSILASWQWADFRSRCWTGGVRWSLGLVVVLVPAGAGLLQVGATLVVGLLSLQWLQLWSSCLRVIVQATALTAALPTRPRTFLHESSRLLLLAAALPVPFVCAVLAAAGLPAIAALVVAVVVFAALILQGATVLAWRHRPRYLNLRTAAVLVVWAMLSQALPFAAPLAWVIMVFWLLRRAGKEAS